MEEQTKVVPAGDRNGQNRILGHQGKIKEFIGIRVPANNILRYRGGKSPNDAGGRVGVNNIRRTLKPLDSFIIGGKGVRTNQRLGKLHGGGAFGIDLQAWSGFGETLNEDWSVGAFQRNLIQQSQAPAIF